MPTAQGYWRISRKQAIIAQNNNQMIKIIPGLLEHYIDNVFGAYKK